MSVNDSAELSVSRKSRSPVTPLRTVLAWHLGWGIGLVVAGAMLALALRYAPHVALRSLGVGLAPAVLAGLLAARDAPRARDFLLVAWTIAAVLACGMSGGVAGPLGAWLAAPMMAGAVLGGPGRLARGAALSLLAAAVVALAQADGLVGAPPLPAVATGLGLIGTLSLAIGLASALLAAQREAARLLDVEAQAARTLRQSLDNLPVLTAITNVSGQVESLFGAASAPLLSSGLLLEGGLPGLAEDSDRRAVERALAEAAAIGRASLSLRIAVEPRCWLAMDIRRLSNVRLIVAMRDTTSERDREQALERARADAEALNLGKSRFLANMSHELRTPLNAIMGFSDVMRQRIFGELPGRYAEYADLIHDAGAHLLDLINDVLDMSKIEAARYELALEIVDAREPVQAALRLMRLQADDVGVQLRGVLPSTALMIEADQRALKQITLNLVSNALKFTPKGGLVTVSLRTAGGAMELTVADTGVGIAAEDLERLGRPYEQTGDVEQQRRGTGLGLSLVRAFAELHGGEMVIESRLGEGTAVTVRLPVGSAAPAEAREVEAALIA